MAARHEALARDILEIHADFFMAVYGYRKTRARLLARGRDPAEIGRDQVMNVMRESGIRGVRRGRTPVTTKPAKGAGGSVYGQINVYGVTTKSERHKRSYWTRTADGNGIGGRKAPVPYGS